RAPRRDAQPGREGGPVDVATVGPGHPDLLTAGPGAAAVVEHGGEVGVVAARDQVLDHREVEGRGLLQGAPVDAPDGLAALPAALGDQVERAVADAAVGVDAAVVERAAHVSLAGRGVGLPELPGVLHVPDRADRE